MNDLVVLPAREESASALAEMNAQLIRDEGSRNRMTPDQLATRMRNFLRSGYVAFVFRVRDQSAGYVLYRHEPHRVFVRHFFIRKEFRKKGIGSAAFEYLLESHWASDVAVELDVISANRAARDFWRSLGFEEYAVRLSLSTAKKQKTVKSCGAVVYSWGLGAPRYLLVKHLKNGHWGFPKGHVVDGESEIETARREIAEETGLEVTFVENFHEMMYYLTPKSRRKEVVLFLARARSRRVKRQRDEILASRWLKFDAALESLTHENARAILVAAHRRVLDEGRKVLPRRK